MRLPLADLPPSLRPGLEGLEAFIAALPVEPSAKAIIANCSIDGDYVNFTTNKQGGVENIYCDISGPHFPASYGSVRESYQQKVSALLNCPVDAQDPSAAFLKLILQNPQFVVVIDHTDPVIVPFLNERAPILNQQAAVGAMERGSSKGWLWLLLLLLLLLAGFIYLKYFYPWPFVKPETPSILQEQEVTIQPAPVETTEPLPQCEVIHKRGEWPELFIALDGSGSMTKEFPPQSKRIDIALEAVYALVDRIDPNVSIHFVGIQGCPVAKDFGSYKYNKRVTLKTLMKKMDLSKSLSKNPELVNTPLISAISIIANKAPAHADSVAIIVSDGLDTCEAPGFNFDNFMQTIHELQPRLKINIIYMGNPADIPTIKCIADLTGGQIYSPDTAETLIENIEQASQTLVKVCK